VRLPRNVPPAGPILPVPSRYRSPAVAALDGGLPGIAYRIVSAAAENSIPPPEVGPYRLVKLSIIRALPVCDNPIGEFELKGGGSAGLCSGDAPTVRLVGGDGNTRGFKPLIERVFGHWSAEYIPGRASRSRETTRARTTRVLPLVKTDHAHAARAQLLDEATTARIKANRRAR